MSEYMTVQEVADHLGVSRDRAPKVMSENGIRSIRVYPTEQVRMVTRPGQGARTDLDRNVGATVELAGWGRYGMYADLSDDVTAFLGEFEDDYDVPALVDAYRDAINAGLEDTGISLAANDDFYGTVPTPEDWDDVIRDAISAVDLGTLAAANEETRA